jgi:hypothetical protein
LPAWRLLVVETGRVLAERYDDLVIAPMTVVDPRYAQETSAASRRTGSGSGTSS